MGWHKGGEKRVFNKGRVNWYGRDPDWKDVAADSAARTT